MWRLRIIAMVILLLVTGLLAACGSQASDEPGQGPKAVPRPTPAVRTEVKVMSNPVKGEWDIHVFTPTDQTYLGHEKLNGLAAISSQDIWAVGGSIVHWDGANWATSPIPVDNPATVLNDVAGTAQDDIWAVGVTGGRPLMLHYDGKQWKQVSAPDVQLEPHAVTAIARDDVWAVGSGDPPAMHWDGREWSSVPIPGVTDSMGAELGGGLRDVAALSTDAIWAVSESDETPQLHYWNGKKWSQSSIPFRGASLDGLSVLSPNDIWATGHAYYGNSPSPVFLHWNGKEWSQVSAEIEASWNSPSSIVAVGPDNVWAAGTTGVWHWDGKSWSTMPNPIASMVGKEPGYYGFSTIAVLGSEVWAAGSIYGTPRAEGVIGHFAPVSQTESHPSDRTSATPSATPRLAAATATSVPVITAASPTRVKVTDPVPGEWDTPLITPSHEITQSFASLTGLAAISSHDVWAVGVWVQLPASRHPLAMHWDDTAWTSVPVPAQDGALLRDVAGTAQDDVWAVGQIGDSPLIVHYNGKQWEAVSAPSVQILPQAVTAVARDDAWVIGSSQSPGACLSALHWDGKEWSGVPVPGETGSSCVIGDLVGLSSDDAWAVGTSDFTGLVLHWNGKEWSRSPLPFDGKFGEAMTNVGGISALSGQDVWATGSYYGNDTAAHPLFLHWDGSEWTQLSAEIEAASNSPSSISAVASDNVWAAGPTGVWHWDGKKWSTVPNPISSMVGKASDLAGFSTIAAISSEVWAAGSIYDQQAFKAVIAHFVLK